MQSTLRLTRLTLLLLAPSTALAADDHVERTMDDGYAYAFRDEVLEAAPPLEKSMRLRVRERAARSTLIKPRGSFVPELRKSIEQL